MNIILFPEGTRSFLKDDERYVHLKKVLHATPGSAFSAGEINGKAGKAVITRMDSEEIAFDFFPEKEDKAFQPLTVLLAQVRPICMRRILRELVSFGVEKIILVVSELGEKSYSSSGLYASGEYKDILLSGAMQGGKTGVSEVVFASSVKRALALVPESEKLLLDNKVGVKSFSELELEEKRVTLAVGPERGWSDRERELFLSSSWIPVKMGEHILRTETAAVASVSLALSVMKLI